MWKNAGKPRTKSEYEREVDAGPSSQLADSPQKTSAPVNCGEIAQLSVNRGVASSNLARGANLLLNCQTLTTAFGTLGTTSPSLDLARPVEYFARAGVICLDSR